MIFAFILSLGTIGLGGFLIYNEKNIEGIGLILFDLVSLAGVFVYGKHAQREELKSSRASFTPQITTHQ